MRTRGSIYILPHLHSLAKKVGGGWGAEQNAEVNDVHGEKHPRERWLYTKQQRGGGGSEKHPRALTPCFLLCCVIRRGHSIRTRLYDLLLNANSKTGPVLAGAALNNTSFIAVISVLFDLLICFFQAPQGLISYVFICHHVSKFCEKSEFILVNIWGKNEKAFLLLSKISNERFRSLYSTFCYLPVWFVFHVAALPHFLVPGIENSWLYKKRKPTEWRRVLF